jgi:hypothetical protein
MRTFTSIEKNQFMFSRLFILLFMLAALQTSRAQFGFVYNDSIPVFVGGDSLTMAWVGGLNHAQFSSFDYDFDGEEDLFIFDRSADQIRVFVRRFDSEGNPYYKYVQDARSRFPADVRYRASLVDYNQDGKKDLFTYGIGGVKVYKNIGNATDGLQWELASNLLRTDYLGTNSNLFVSSIDIPAFVDIDHDGDIDVLTFHIGGQRVEYHKNMSMENYGVPDSLEFVLKNECWGQFIEDELNNSVTLFATQGPCGGGSTIPDPQKNLRHAGSCLLAIDLNEDMVMDLVLGDVSHNNLTKLINGGTAPNQNSPMISQDPNFPSNTTPVDLSTFPCGFYVDVDHDGVNDLVVGTNAAGIAQNYRSAWYYKNIGTNEAPVFSFVQNDFFQTDMIENGRGSVPVFVDVNGDGLLDMLVATNYRYKPVLDKETRIQYFQNTGTNEAPQFTFVSDDWMNFSSAALGRRVIPTFGDVDGDGDLDMIVGTETGHLHYYENTGGAGAMNFSTPPVLQLTDSDGVTINLNSFATPYLFDVDNDGLLDLIVGRRMGGMFYYKNIGTATAPSFSFVTNNWGNISLGTPVNPESYAVPQLVRHNDTLHLFVGCRAGTVHYYKDIEDNLFDGGIFTQISSNYGGFNTGGFSAPAITQLTDDNSYFMFLGGDLGGVWSFKADPFSSIIEDTLNVIELNALHDWSVFPNPTSTGEFTIEPNQNNTIYLADVLDLVGREIHKGVQVFGPTKIAIPHAESGMYVVRLRSKEGVVIGVRRVIVSRE